MLIYQGEGTWDSNNSICLYNGKPVFDVDLENPISSEENCGSVYKME